MHRYDPKGLRSAAGWRLERQAQAAACIGLLSLLLLCFARC